MQRTGPQRRANWMEAYDVQMNLADWYLTPPGLAWLKGSAAHNLSALEHTDTKQLLAQLYQSERFRLSTCDPIFVSEEMCDLVEHAADSFEPEPLLVTDVMTTRGFMYFERPFTIPDRFEDPLDLAAVSWTRLFTTPNAEVAAKAEALMRGGWDGTAEELDQALERMPEVEVNGLAVTLYCRKEDAIAKGAKLGPSTPAIVTLHLTPWYFGMTFDGNEVTDQGEPSGAGWWWRTVQTCLRLSQQRVAVKHMQRLDRAGRRDAKKRWLGPDPMVVAVRLRREASQNSEPTGESANYSHRFIVGGHWRMQPYRSEGIVRQIWINSYIKGDEELPLIIKPKRVYTWDR